MAHVSLPTTSFASQTAYPPRPHGPSEGDAARLVADVAHYGSPKNVRSSFSEYEEKEKASKSQIFSAVASGFALGTAFCAIPAASVAASQSCANLALEEAKAKCGTSFASILGGILGITGAVFTGYSIHLIRHNLGQFVKTKDTELARRFGDSTRAKSDRHSAHNLMSRFVSLSESDRKIVMDGLFQAYLKNKRPVRAEAPAGQASLEVRALSSEEHAQASGEIVEGRENSTESSSRQADQYRYIVSTSSKKGL